MSSARLLESIFSEDTFSLLFLVCRNLYMQWPIQHKVVVAIDFKCRRIILNTKFAIPFLVVTHAFHVYGLL